MFVIRELLRSVARRKADTAWVVGAVGLALALGGVLGTLASSVLAPRWSAGSRAAVRFVETRTPLGAMDVSLQDAERIRERFGPDSVAITRPERASIRVGTRVYPVAGEAVSGSYFRLLDVVPLAGRLFGPADAGPARDGPVVISRRLAVRLYGRESEAVGKRFRVQLGGFMGSYDERSVSLEVVGLVPDPFTGTIDPWQRTDYWIPIGMRQTGQNDSDLYVRAFGLFGASRALQQNTSRILESLSAEQPPAGAAFGGAARFGLTRIPPTRLPSLLGRASPESLGLPLLLAAACVVVIAATNIIGLARCQLYYRDAEIQVRALLGATRARLGLLLCGEQALKGAIAVGVGLLLASASLGLLQYATPGEIGGWLYPVREFTLDTRSEWGVFAVVAVTGAAVVLVLCALHVHHIARTHRADAPRPRARVPGAVTYGVLLPQIAISAAASVVSASIVSGVLQQEIRNLGYSPADLSFVEFELPAARRDSVPAPGDDRRTLNLRLLERVQHVPGTRVAALSTGLPFTPTSAFVGLPDSGAARHRASEFIVSERYFEAMRIQVSGRSFRLPDRVGSRPVCIVSRSLARAVWPNGDPIGRELGSAAPGGGPIRETWEVVGIADDVYATGVRGEPAEAVYLPLAQQAVPRATTVIVRGPVASAAFRQAVHQAISGADARLNIARARIVEDALAEIKYPRRLVLGTIALIAGVGWLFTVVGLFALLSLAALHRERELAIRTALGAPRRSIAWALLRTGVVVAGLGLCVGGWCGWAALELMQERLTITAGVGLGGVVAGVLATAATVAAAAWLPLRRACRLTVAETLKAV